MRTLLLSLILSLTFTSFILAQSTTKPGAWTDPTVWSGGSVPPGWTTVNVGHVITKNSGLNVQGTLNVNATGTLTITGDVTITGGSFINVFGNLVITGDLTLYGFLNINPGGTVTVNGTTYVESSQYLNIGTAAGPPYANMIIKQNLVSRNSGDVVVNRNGRLAVFGNYSSSSGGGTDILVRDGGQVYINGTITFTGGGDHLKNDNDGNPYYGFYSPNQPTFSGSDSGSNGAAGANSVQGVSQIPTEFRDWLVSIPNSPLPVKLQYFKVASVSEQGISLEWATSMEKNFSHFEVQRAGAQLSFSNIGIVQGKGGLEVKTVYSLLDDAPLNGKNYYRLKAIDFDGSSEYFNVIAADWNGTAGTRLYPNPVIDNSFTIDIGDQYGESVNVVVYEARGYIIYSVAVASKSATVKLPENTSAGVYLVRLSSASKQQVIRVVVN